MKTSRQQNDQFSRRLADVRELRGYSQDELAQRLTAVEAELYQINNQSAKDKIAFPIKLNDRLAGLLWNIQRADGRPNRAHYEVFRELSNELDGHLAALDALLEEAKASGS